MAGIFGVPGGAPRRRSSWTMRLVPLLLGAVAIGVMMIQNCNPGPFGRDQVLGLDAKQEEALGLQAFEEVLAKERVVRGGPAVDAVREVARRLTDAADEAMYLDLIKLPDQPMNWQVEVVESEQRNAFCLPGGKIVVYTGILPVCYDDAGLATVMGHEIAHALGRHGNERITQQQMVNIGLVAASGAMGDADPAQRQQILGLLSAGVQMGVLKYSREHESEADHMGVLLMAAAGYDPRESIRFWERMQQAAGQGQAPPEFVSTHPSHDTRIADLNQWIPQAMPLYEAAPEKVAAKRLPSSGGRLELP